VKEEIIRRKGVPRGNSAIELVKSLQRSLSAVKRCRCYICKNLQNIQPNATNVCDLCSKHSTVIKKRNNYY